MRPTLVLRFPRGRYAATPWGEPRSTHELPPSPWRLLRAIYATWRNRCPELDEAVVHALLGRLARPPVFDVPRHAVRDGVVLFERDAELAVHWPVDLTAAQYEAFAELAAAIPYLGRADSRCIGRLDQGWLPSGHESWSPVDVADSVPSNYAGTALLAPTLPLQISDLLDAPAELRRRGLPLPAGARLLGYQRDPRLDWSGLPARLATAVRFSVARAVEPTPCTESVVYTDLLRQAALSQLGRLRDEPEHTALGGKAADQQALAEQHQHAHYLPVIEQDRLTGLLVWTPGGLPHDELKALTAVRVLKAAWCTALPLRLVGVGDVDSLAPWLVRPSRTWRCATPFTPPRHHKRPARWEDFVRSEVARELRHRGKPQPRAVEIIDSDWVAWRRYRPSARLRRDPRQGSANRPSAFLRIEFDSPVCGPLALGHLSHFGLGLFQPR